VENSFREVLSFRSISSDLLAHGISKHYVSTLSNRTVGGKGGEECEARYRVKNG
jgi:hypothetical protein